MENTTTTGETTTTMENTTTTGETTTAMENTTTSAETTTTGAETTTTGAETTTTAEQTTTTETTTTENKCPGVGHPCEVIGADNLACCGVEFGPGKAFCQTDPNYICCEGETYAISCPKQADCTIDDSGLPNCGRFFS